MGGEIKADSAPGCGSKFQFEISLEAPPDQRPVEDGKRIAAGRSVLLVSANRNIQMCYHAMLESLGLNVIVIDPASSSFDEAWGRTAQPGQPN